MIGVEVAQPVAVEGSSLAVQLGTDLASRPLRLFGLPTFVTVSALAMLTYSRVAYFMAGQLQAADDLVTEEDVREEVVELVARVARTSHRLLFAPMLISILCFAVVPSLPPVVTQLLVWGLCFVYFSGSMVFLYGELRSWAHSRDHIFRSRIGAGGSTVDGDGTVRGVGTRAAKPLFVPCDKAESVFGRKATYSQVDEQCSICMEMLCPTTACVEPAVDICHKEVDCDGKCEDPFGLESVNGDSTDVGDAVEIVNEEANDVVGDLSPGDRHVVRQRLGGRIGLFTSIFQVRCDGLSSIASVPETETVASDVASVAEVAKVESAMISVNLLNGPCNRLTGLPVALMLELSVVDEAVVDGMSDPSATRPEPDPATNTTTDTVGQGSLAPQRSLASVGRQWQVLLTSKHVYKLRLLHAASWNLAQPRVYGEVTVRLGDVAGQCDVDLVFETPQRSSDGSAAGAAPVQSWELSRGAQRWRQGVTALQFIARPHAGDISDNGVGEPGLYDDSDVGAKSGPGIPVLKLHDEETAETQTQVVALRCGHVFHQACVEEWLHRSHRCPLCRESVGGARRALQFLF